MNIFGYIINGKDADDFMALSCAKKKAWIKANTGQKHDVLIEAFVKNVSRGTDENECKGCKDERKAISATTTTATTTTDAAKDSGKGVSAGTRRTNRPKGSGV